MSPTRKKIVASAATISALAIALPLLFIPSTACACLSPSMMFGRVLGVDLVDATEPELSAAILRSFPIGTPRDQIEQALDQVDPSGGHNPLCTGTDPAIRCHMDLGSSVLGVHRRDLDIELTLDQADRLAGVRVRKQRWILGLQL